MEQNKLYDRILGSLLTAGVGDALGAPSEAFSPAEIKAQFGRITKFEDPSNNCISPDNKIGEVTDDSSQMYEMARAVVRSGGDFTAQDAADALIYWAQHYPKYYPRNAGPTTQHVIKALLAGEDPITVGQTGKMYGRGTSNGAVMRVAAAGLIHPGDYEGAIQTAVAMSAPSHGTQHAYSGAAAIACAIAEALTPHSSVWSILRAGLYGAQQGEKIGRRTARIAAGIPVYPKVVKAIEIALRCRDMQEAETELECTIGADDISVQGTTALALGLFAAADGDSMKTILSGANIGGDTDTIACVAGMIAGAYNGTGAIDGQLLAQFEQANTSFDFRGVAQGLCDIACRQQCAN
ncbi:ADP-ribosylglycohydrolase family protein [Neobittarella massiliensis]|uniref:ADP-ribosylglycohydrolase family protein n=1 Tax=Neobittarella massiliensis (ex Bilen et al. 2018) TaxID=2041842 RepID=UPI000CF6AE25|nr:ADP-ribosylglycohydrolase family protein [Neobittarella massiliensis]